MDDTVRTRPDPAADDGAGTVTGRMRQTNPLPAAALPTTARRTVPLPAVAPATPPPAAVPPPEEPAPDAAQALIRRAPSGYLWNQAYGLWLFVSLLLVEVLIRRALPLREAGVYTAISTTANTGFYIASLGLSSAGQVYVPRALAEGGPARAMAVALRLVLMRTVAVLVLCAGFLWGLNAAAGLLTGTGLPWLAGLSHALGDSVLTQHRAMIAAYILGVGMSNLLGALLVALLRTRIVFVVGGLSQLLLLLLIYGFVRVARTGADGALAAQALPAMLAAVVYAVALGRVLRARPDAGGQPLMAPMLRFGAAAWLADLPGTSLVKPMALGQLAAVSPITDWPLFESAYQMGDAGNQFFTEGLGGVSLAVMSAAYARRHMGPLATAWRTVSKLQVLLALPVVAFCVPNATAIMVALYGAKYSTAGPFLALFLILNGVVQALGGAAHDWALYAQGRQRWVVLARWGSLGLLAGLGLLLTPRFFVVGALLAVGLSRVAATATLLAIARASVRRAYPAGFAARVVLASVVPAAPSLFWRPTSLPGLLLAGLLYTVIFLACLRLLRPLDAEDAALLAQVPRPLQVILRPFAADAGPGAGRALGSVSQPLTPEMPSTAPGEPRP